MKPLAHTYYVYGITLHSEMPLCLPEEGCGDLANIELRETPASFFAQAIEGVPLEQASGSWYQAGRLPEGSYYLRWQGVGEFLVSSDGHRMLCRQFDVATSESFQVYMLGQALSVALVHLGFEPIHATAIEAGGEAIVFLGDSGFGKSTLAASFLNAGYRMVTDDLLILRENESYVFAYPGPPRIKLFLDSARTFLPGAAGGVPMNVDTEKLIVPLCSHETCPVPVMVKATFALVPPCDAVLEQQVRIEAMSGSEAFLELVKNTFNRRIINADRLQRQIHETAHIVNLLRIRRLSVLRNLSGLDAVRHAIIAASQRDSLEVLTCTN